jgi:hypothetical protein
LLLDREHNVADIEIHAFRLDYKLLDFALQKTLAVTRPRLWNLGHHRSNPGTHFEPALLDQVLYDFVRCIRVDLELDRERSNRWKRLARPEFTIDERPFDGKQQLIKDGFARMQIEPE